MITLKADESSALLVREHGKIYALFYRNGKSILISESGEEITVRRSIIDSYPYLIAKLDSEGAKVVVKRSIGYDVAEVNGNKIYGRTLFDVKWTGEVLPFYDMNSRNVIDLVTGKTIVNDLGNVLPVRSNRCGGITKLRIFVVTPKGTQLLEIDERGNVKVIARTPIRVEGVTPSGTAYKCFESECYYIDCNGLKMRIRNAFRIVGNALLAKDHVVYELLRSGSGNNEVNRMLAIDSNGYPKTPSQPLRDVTLIDSRGYEILVSGYRVSNKTELWCVAVFKLEAQEIVPKYALCDNYPLILDDEILFNDKGDLVALRGKSLEKIEVT
ncbi:hypothetical protein EYM_02860 [Ignicoccus islandicus DSM 13165]|uniref:Uncharacterized protein n=1 Tax=Ignicoccus islandicus DSM 13165 TaxID=940295 RepID=A0A0U2MAT1_9CREN|nr:hypothetical protein [Ignicoccus islandicus]ALU12365.1 hypothetical protein EYM_02860 [Ignicoccus islandicus DSM 13165]